jgi:hypothetical protein
MFIMSMDYLGINYDYQDNIYLISNITPTATAVPAPATPTGFAATPSAAGVFLNWNDNTAGTFAGYNVYRDSSADFTPGDGNKLNGSLLTSSEFNDTTAPTGLQVHFKVVAVNSAGAPSSAASASATRPAPEPVPATPTGLNAAAVSTSAINVSWNASPGATTYILERRQGASGNFSVVANGLTATAFADSGLTPSTEYQYRVSASNAGGQASAASAAVSEQTLGVTDPTPVTASVVDATAVNEPASGSTATVTFTVTLGAPSTEAVSLNYSTADGTALAGSDYTAATGVLTFAPGETSKTITVDVLADGATEAAEGFTLNLSAAGTNVTVTDGQAAGTIAANGDGGPGSQVLPFGGKQKASYLGLDGRTVRVSLKGLGSGEVTVLGNGTASIVTNGTTAASALTISGATALQGVTVNGGLRSFTGKTVDVNGNLALTGSLSKLTLRNATGGQLTVGGANVPTSITLANATDFGVNSASAIKSVRAAQWTDTGGAAESITAPLLSSGTIKGDLSTDVTVGQLQRLTVGGALTGSDIRSAGDVMSLRVGRAANSRVFAGVGVGQNGLPDSMDDFANAAAQIKSVSVTSKAAGAFVDTLIAAPHVGSVSLGSIVTGNAGNAFGVSGDSIATVRGSTGTKLSLKGLDEPSETETEGDFVARVL